MIAQEKLVMVGVLLVLILSGCSQAIEQWEISQKMPDSQIPANVLEKYNELKRNCQSSSPYDAKLKFCEKETETMFEISESCNKQTYFYAKSGELIEHITYPERKADHSTDANYTASLERQQAILKDFDCVIVKDSTRG